MKVFNTVVSDIQYFPHREVHSMELISQEKVWSS